MEFKRIISIIASISLSMSSVVIPQAEAFHSSYTGIIDVTNKTVATVASGFCGSELRWWLEDNGTLTISGNDTMTTHPWTSQGLLKSIKKIVIDKDVQTICNNAFEGAENLQSVTFEGNALRSIGANAFSSCTSLSSISVPSGVTFIGERAFSSCTKMTSCYIPESVVHIERYAFSGNGCCETSKGAIYVGSWVVDSVPGATSATLRAGTKHIADRAFMDCKSLKTVYLPNTLLDISSGAFYGTGITSLNIPGSVRTIGNSAFKFCISLETLTFGNGIEIIDSSAFSNCNRLTSVEFPASVTSIGSEAFFDCTSLSKINFNSDPTISAYAFGFSTSNSGVSRDVYAYDGSDAAILFDSDSAYAYNAVLHPLGGKGTFGTMSWSFTTDGILTISGTGALKADTSTSNKAWYSFRKRVKKIIVTGNFTSVEDNAFSGYQNLVSISLPDSVATIGKNAFRNCNALSQFHIPTDLSTIGSYAFSGCASLTQANLPSSLESIGSYAYENCTSLKSVSVPAGAVSVGEKAFYGCTKLEKISFSGEKTTIYNSAFTIPENAVIYGKPSSTASTYASKYSRKFVEIGDEHTNGNITWTYFNDGRLIISGSGSMPDWSEKAPAPWSEYSDTIKSVTIEDGVTSIGSYAFYGFKSLKYEENIVIPESVTSIGGSAFRNCTSLSDIELPDNLKSIGSYTFAGCKKLNISSFPKALISIGDNAFENCTSLIGYPEKVYDSDDKWDYHLEYTLILPDSLETLGSNAFNGCTGIKGVSLGKNLLSVGKGAFEGCTSIEKLKLHCDCAVLPENTFSSNAEFSVVLDTGASNAEKAFSQDGCLFNTVISGIEASDVYKTDDNHTMLLTSDGKKLVHFFSPKSVNSYNVSDVIIPDDVEVICAYAFYKCRYIGDIRCGNGIKVIEDHAFYLSGSDGNFILPEGLETIGDYAFQECSINSLTIKCNSSVFKSDAFSEVYSGPINVIIGSKVDDVTTFPLFAYDLENIIVEAENKHYSSADGVLFSKDGKILLRCPKRKKDYTIPDGVVEIADRAFQDCSRVSGIFPESLEIIGNLTFKNCILNEIDIPENVKRIGNSAFANSSAYLKSLSIKCSSSAFFDDSLKGLNFKSLETITIGKAFDNIDIIQITGNALKNINVEKGNEHYSSIDGILLSGDGKELIRFPANKITSNDLLKPVSIPDGVVIVKSNAFIGCQYITEITLPDSLTTIEENAFNDTNKNIYLVNIGAGLKSGENLPYAPDEINVSDSNPYLIMNGNFLCSRDKKIIYRAIAYLPNHEKISEIPDGTEKIASYAFCNNSILEKADLPDTVKEIGNHAFSGCSLKSVTLPQKLISIGSYAFSNCMKASVSTAGAVDSNCINLRIPDSVTEIGEGAFMNWKALKEIAIPDGITVLNDYLFKNCSSLSVLTLPTKMKSIGKEVFYGCYSLKILTIPEGIKKLTYHTVSSGLSSKGALEELVLPVSMSKVEKYAFSGYSNPFKLTVLNPYTDLSALNKSLNDWVTICGYDGSTAEKLAKNAKLTFISLGTPPSSITPNVVLGDVNDDGIVSVADIVSLQNYLLGRTKTLENWENADLCKDNRLNAYDMILMRRLLIENMK